MDRYIYVFIFLVMPVFLYATDCEDNLTVGINLFEQKKYEDAKRAFEYVLREYKSECGDVKAWIKKCEEALDQNSTNQITHSIPTEPVVTLKVSRKEIYVSAGSVTEDVVISCNTNWNFESQANWCNGVKQGNKLWLQIKENNSNHSRECTITISANNKIELITINQSGKQQPNQRSSKAGFARGNIDAIIGGGLTQQKPKQGEKANEVLSLSKYEVNVSDQKGSEEIQVTSSKPNWKIGDCKQNWLKVEKDGNYIKVSYDENKSADKRDYTITVYTDHPYNFKTVKIIQEGKTPFLDVDPQKLKCPSNKSEQIIEVTSNTEWKAYISEKKMVQIIKEGKDILKIQVNKNSSTKSRECTITIKTKKGSLSKEIKVIQEGKPEVKPRNFIIANGGFSTLPDYSYGLTYARVKRAGFYFSAMSNFNFRFNADYKGDSNASIDGIYPMYSGQREYTKLTASTGLVVRFADPIYMYLGAGYGFRGLFYENTNQEWVEVHNQYSIYHGGVGEIGLIGNIYGFSLSLGLSIITDFNNCYPEAKVGIGYCF